MNKAERDLWSNMNNSNNSANYDNWANAHNPNNSNYIYSDDDDDEKFIFDKFSDYSCLGMYKTSSNYNSKYSEEKIRFIELIKEAIEKTSEDKKYSFISKIATYLSNLSKPIYPYNADVKTWSEFIKNYPFEFRTFYLQNSQSNMCVEIIYSEEISSSKENCSIYDKLFKR